MTFSGLAYFLFTMFLAIVMGGIIVYYYNPGRKEKIEEPKRRMLDEEQ